MESTHFPNLYAGRKGFEIFLKKHLVKYRLPPDMRELLLTKRDLQDNYINFCCVYGYPIASFVCIGKHLTYLGITVKAYIGPHGHQLPSYSDLMLSREALDLDLLAHGKPAGKKDLDISEYMDQDLTDHTSSQDTDDDTDSESSFSDDEVDSILEDQLSIVKDGVVQETPHPTRNSGGQDRWGTTGYTSWDAGVYTQQDKNTVFEYVQCLEDFVASFS